jgi:transcriptional repressor NrdR
MRCPFCKNPDSRVTDSRTVEDGAGIRRRRECSQCGLRFTTYERVQSSVLMVAKNDGSREGFNRDKLTSGIVKACAKRPVTSWDIEKLVEDIEANLNHLGQAEIPANTLGEMVMERLRQLDRVAYIRFASVYRDFQDIDSFEEAVKDLRENPEQLSFIEGISPPPTSRGRKGRRRGAVLNTTSPELDNNGLTEGVANE